ncbi:MAG: glycoside hydrolase family 3 N-terminal domain-containing protein [Pseudomonadota bacterium]
MSDLKVGELFVLGFRGKTVPDWVKEFSKKYGLGGVILFDSAGMGNISTPEETKKLCAEVHQLGAMNFVDQEGGLVRRLKDWNHKSVVERRKKDKTLKEQDFYKPLPSQQELAKLDEAKKREILLASFKEMKELGFDYNFGLVLDVDYYKDADKRKKNKIKNDINQFGRSYSEDPKIVKENALLAAQAAKEVNLGLVLKHFPGIGGAVTNSHHDVTDISDSIAKNPEQEQLFYNVLPHVPGETMLVAHTLVNQWDPKNPSSMSADTIHRIRQRNDKALLITDDIQMGGASKLKNLKDAALAALQAGVDMVCINNTIPAEEETVKGIAAFIDDCLDKGLLKKEDIEQSIARVQDRKKLFMNGTTTQKLASSTPYNWDVQISPGQYSYSKLADAA